MYHYLSNQKTEVVYKRREHKGHERKEEKALMCACTRESAEKKREKKDGHRGVE